jgi:UDP-N-acetylglucosamine 2-epimerase (non-hydrolysing)
MKRILVCFGTRPEAIKMCVLVHELRKSGFEVSVCVTAQHRQMLDQVLDFFELKPNYDLDIMSPNQTLNGLSGRIFIKMDEVIDDFKPELILVHGDTTTSSICAWAGFNKGIKVGHIEAGLRTYNKYSPFPEEMNRQITGRLADFHFAPTENSKNNLVQERTPSDSIVVTGNTVIDSLLWTVNKIEINYTNDTIKELSNLIDFNKRVILVTGHRRENFGDGIENICSALLEIAKQDDVEVVYPVHLNPNIKEPVERLLSKNKNIHLISPLDYSTFVWMMKKSYIIITDSGGVQEEAPSLGKPVLVMRDTTERPEAVKAGTVKLVGTNCEGIINSTLELLNDFGLYEKMSQAYNPYGDGKSCERIVDFLKLTL